MHAQTKLLCAAAASLLMAGSARADLLGLTLQDTPDIASRFIDTSYNATTDIFVAAGVALLFDDDGSTPAEDILNGSFNITAEITALGQPVGGTLTVGGDVLGFGPSLLTGSLKAFGFQNGGGPIFEFVFTVTGGELAGPYFGGVGAQIGLILSGVGFTGSFGSNFDNLINGIPGTGSGVSDLAPLPAPGVLSLLGAALVFGPRRRRR
jgi:hypothetical protein